MQKTQENGFPFVYDGWDTDGDYGDILFYEVEFTDDFGSIKKGDKFNGVSVEHSKARLIARCFSQEKGVLTREVVVQWKAVPVATA